jgi:DNA-binding MarR family transcriptional regulator
MEKQLAILSELAQVGPIKAGLDELINSLRATKHLGEEWRTPKLLRILSETVTLGKRPPYDQVVENPQDPAAFAVKVGDGLLASGKVDAAIEKYREAAKVHNSSWRDVAHVRIGVLLAQAGDLKAARNAIHNSLTSELQVSMSPPHELLNDELTADEESVLDVLNTNVTLDEAQVGSKALLSPQRCSAALRSLRDRGLVEVVEGPRDSRRFRRTFVDLQSQG